MATVVCFAIDDELRAIALSAARWIPGFYPHVTLFEADNAIKLTTTDATVDADMLERIWIAAVVNERLTSAAAARRAQAFGQLAQ